MSQAPRSLQECLKAAFPATTLQLLQEAARAEPDFGRISRIISLDPALTVAVLGLANSPLYGQAIKIDDLERAAVTLGSREILNLALSVSFLASVKDRGAELYPNWRLTIMGAVAARLVAQRINAEVENRAYLAGLLKDLSMLLALCVPELHGSVPQGSPPALARQGAVIFPGTMEEGQDPPDHGQATADLLLEAGLPAGCAEGIIHHHDLESLEQRSVCAQAVILGTRWAEVLLGCVSDPSEVLRFELLLKSRLHLDAEALEEMRAELVGRYMDMIHSVNIDESSDGEHYYHYSLAELQHAYLLGMEVTHLPDEELDGAVAAACNIARQLRWNYDVDDADLALLTPERRDYMHFRCHGGAALASAERALELDDLPWRFDDHGMPLYSGGRYLGELRLPLRASRAGLGGLLLYVRFLAMGYDHYLRRQAVLEMKVRTLDRLPIGVARVDSLGRLLECNRLMAQVLDIDPVPVGADILDLLRKALGLTLEPEWREFFRNDARQTLGRIFCDLSIRGPHRGPCMYLCAVRHQWAEGQELLLLLQDISGITELEVESLLRLDFLSRLLGSMQELVLTCQHDGTITFVSPNMPAELMGKNLFQVAKPIVGPSREWRPEVFDEPRLPPAEVVFNLAQGDIRPMELVFSTLADGDQHQRFLIVGRDLTKIRRLEEAIKRQAVYDGLTGLYNHEQFRQLLARECRRAERLGRPLTLLFFDLDGFKTVNDTLGHQAGDEILRRLGQMLLRKTRFGLDFPCRYGGDEFAILFTETEVAQVRQVADRLAELARSEFRGGIGLSIGLAGFKAGELPEDFLRRADQACYEAKRCGGGRTILAPLPE